MTSKKPKRGECGDARSGIGSNTSIIDKIVGHEDLLTEILSRVPTKSLINTIRCVCKSWLTLTTDPKFCYKHSALNRKVVSIIYYYDRYKLMSLSLDGHQSHPRLSFLQGQGNRTKSHFEDSCNGLILCAGFPERYQYSVCNLTTQKISIIPRLDSRKTNKNIVMCLAFDPLKSPYHKAVKFNKSYSSKGVVRVDIFSSETKSWRRVDILGWKRVYASRKKIYWDGGIHWLVYNKHFKFDVDLEILKITPSPRTAKEFYCFGERNGNLLLILYQPDSVSERVRILEMKHGTRHWVSKQRVNLGPVLDIRYERPMFSSFSNDKWWALFHVMCVVKGGSSGEDDIVLVLATKSNILSFNPRTEALQVLAKSSELKFGYLHNGLEYGRFPCCQFFESLCPV